MAQNSKSKHVPLKSVTPVRRSDRTTISHKVKALRRQLQNNTEGT